MKRMPSDIEKKIVEKDLTILAVGLVITMVIVWLTIAVTPREHRKYSKECYEACKGQVSEDINFEKGEFLTRAKFIVEMGNCMDDCADFSEAIDEDKKDKSMAD